MMIRPSLKDSLRQLRLSGLLSSLEVRLAEAGFVHGEHRGRVGDGDGGTACAEGKVPLQVRAVHDRRA